MIMTHYRQKKDYRHEKRTKTEFRNKRAKDIFYCQKVSYNYTFIVWNHSVNRVCNDLNISIMSIN